MAKKRTVTGKVGPRKEDDENDLRQKNIFRKKDDNHRGQEAKSLTPGQDGSESRKERRREGQGDGGRRLPSILRPAHSGRPQVIAIVILVLAIVGIIHAASGNMKPLPIVGKARIIK